MKRNLLFGIAVLIIAAGATFTMNVNSDSYGLSEISLANVEALAQSESGSSCEGCLQWNTNTYSCYGIKCKSTGCTEEYFGMCEKWCD